MPMATGKVVDGKIVVEGVHLQDGQSFSIVTPEGEERFDVTDEQKAALLKSLEQARRGETCDGWALLRSLGPNT